MSPPSYFDLMLSPSILRQKEAVNATYIFSFNIKIMLEVCFKEVNSRLQVVSSIFMSRSLGTHMESLCTRDVISSCQESLLGNTCFFCECVAMATHVMM